MYVFMNVTSASPAGVLHAGHCYNLPKEHAKRMLAAKVAGSDLPAAVVESDPEKIKKARRIDSAVQLPPGGDEDFGGDE